jgi:hypothetical protein
VKGGVLERGEEGRERWGKKKKTKRSRVAGNFRLFFAGDEYESDSRKFVPVVGFVQY